MSEWKNLQECFEENGSTFPFKVKACHFVETAWFEVIDKREDWIGFFDCGDGRVFADDHRKWKLYKEPEELVPHWSAIWEGNGEYYLSSRLFPDEQSAKDRASGDLFRLAKELDPIMLPRKK